MIDLLALIKNNPGNRVPFFASALAVPQKTIERWLKTLRSKQAIEFRGSPKKGGYFVLE